MADPEWNDAELIALAILGSMDSHTAGGGLLRVWKRIVLALPPDKHRTFEKIRDDYDTREVLKKLAAEAKLIADMNKVI